MSHIKALTQAKKEKLEYVLILEDDARLVRGFKKKLAEAMKELPDSWNALWLNGTASKKAVKYSSLLNKTVCTWGTFAYVIHNSAFDYFIKGLTETDKSTDGWYVTIQAKYQIFQTLSPLAGHAPGRSDIEMKVVDRYKHLQLK